MEEGYRDQDHDSPRPGHNAVSHSPAPPVYKRCRKGALPFTVPCPMSHVQRPVHPGTSQAGSHHAKRENVGTSGVGGERGGRDLPALALPHQRGSLEGEGLQGLSWPMGTLDCCEDTPSHPGALHCTTVTTGTPRPQGSPVVSLHKSWSGQHKGNTSSPGYPQACQAGGKLLAGQDTGSNPHQPAKRWASLEGNSSKGCSLVPSLTTKSLPRQCVTFSKWLPHPPPAAPSLHPAPCKLLHPMSPQPPGHLGPEEPLLPPIAGAPSGDG